jgi:tetratricopeptide (TPR) repeat protein
MKILYKQFTLSFFFLPFICLAQPDSLIAIGKIKQSTGNYDGAIADFTEAIKRNEAEVSQYLVKLNNYDKISPFDRAEKGIETPAVDINFAIPYYLRGIAYSNTKKNDDALNDFNTTIKINPQLGSAYYERGKILWSVGRKDEGCMDLSMAGSLKDSIAQQLFGENFCWQQALNAYKDASSKLRLNEFQEALDIIQKAVKLCPDSANYLGVRGRAYLGIGKYDLAMQDFDKAVSMNNNSIDAYFGRGMAYYSKNKFQEAFDDLAKAIALDNKFSDAYLYRAYVCEGMEKNQSALYDYQEVQHLCPSDGLAFFRSGMLRNIMNDPKACADFKKAASLGNADAQEYADKCNTTAKKKK